MNDRLQQLAVLVLDKSFALLESGDLEALNLATKTIVRLADYLPDSKPDFSTETEPPKSDNDKAIRQLLLNIGYDDDDWEMLNQSWLTSEQAAEFAGMSADSIRHWCKHDLVHCRHDPLKARKVWMVCPRSVALRINNIPDPRLGGSNE